MLLQIRMTFLTLEDILKNVGNHTVSVPIDMHCVKKYKNTLDVNVTKTILIFRWTIPLNLSHKPTVSCDIQKTLFLKL